MTLEASLDAILSRRVPGDGPGVQVVLVSPNGVLYEGARGLANPVQDADERVSTKHQANLYSVSKFFTACCILKLIEQGKLSLTDKVCDHLPATLREQLLVLDNHNHNQEYTVTVEQLLAHAGGAPNPFPLRWVHKPEETIDETAILAHVLKKNPFQKGKPPLPYHYSNVGYWLLGFVVTTVCDMPNFAQCCQELLFSKVAVSKEDVHVSDRFSPNVPMAYGHVPRWSALALMARVACPKSILGPVNAKWMRMEPHLIDGVAYGGLIGSTRSVSAFLQALLGGAVLDSTEPLVTPLVSHAHHMTFGLHVRPHRGLRIYHKEGGGAGCHSSVQFRPDMQLAGCIISGDATLDVTGLLEELMDRVVDEDSSTSMLPPPREIQVLAREDGVRLCTLHHVVAKHAVMAPWLVADDDKKDTVLLISGGPGVPSDYLQDLAALLIDSNITTCVVSFHPRGVGRSPYTGPITIDNLLNDIDDIRKAYNIETIHLLGHSWGGVLAQLYAQRSPDHVSSLVLLSPSTVSQASDWSNMEMEVLTYNRNKRGWIHFAVLGFWSLVLHLPWVSNVGARRLFAQVMKNYYFDPASAPDPPKDMLSGISAHAMIQSRDAFLRSVKEPMSWDERIPSFCIFGDDDIYGRGTMESFCAGFPGKTEILPRCSHLTWIDQPRRLASLLKTFYGNIGEQ